MAEVTMNVTLLAHTQLSGAFIRSFPENPDCGADCEFTGCVCDEFTYPDSDGQVIALTAIRTCYSPLKPSEIVEAEGSKYFGNDAKDGGNGTEADRLFRQIVKSGHTSTLEHLTFTFAIEGVSRALLAQLTRHRVGFSFSVQSQRYVKLGSDDRSGGFDYVVPETIARDTALLAQFRHFMEETQRNYNWLRACGITAEDARSVLPNATATNLTMTANLRALLDFYAKRRKGRGAQGEIANLSEKLREAVTGVEPWADAFFEAA